MSPKLLPGTVLQIRHFVAIAGRVTADSDRLPVAGAEVQLVGYPPSFKALLETQEKQTGGQTRRLREQHADRTVSGADGHYHFMDLPNGEYEIEVTAEGASERARVRVNLARESIAVQKPERADVTVGIKHLEPTMSPKNSVATRKSGRGKGMQ